MKVCKAGIIGIGGFGKTILRTLNELESEGILKLEAVSETMYDSNKERIEELTAAGVRYYKNYKDLLEKEKDIDFIAIPTPIHLHKQMSTDAMKAGFHVLLEKPPAVTVQDMDDIIKTSDETGRLCAVDFMNASGEAFVNLKNIIREGELGTIKTITGAGLWKRTDSYYSRTDWAGKLVVNGSYVLDGTVNNPLSHLLNNMLLLAHAAAPQKPCTSGNNVSDVTGELYHAHHIEAEDTSCIRIEMDNGIQLLYYATLCHSEDAVPFIIVEGTEGKAYWNYQNLLETSIHGNVEKVSGKSLEGLVLYKNVVSNLCRVIAGEEQELYCPVQATRSFVLASNGAFESSGEMHAIQPEFITRTAEDNTFATCINGIENWINKGIAEKKLFSELGIKWAVQGKRFNVKNYKDFNMFR